MNISDAQVDNLVNLLDGYVEKGGHHLNVNVLQEKLFWTLRLILRNIPSSQFVCPDMQ